MGMGGVAVEANSARRSRETAAQRPSHSPLPHTYATRAAPTPRNPTQGTRTKHPPPPGQCPGAAHNNTPTKSHPKTIQGSAPVERPPRDELRHDRQLVGPRDGAHEQHHIGVAQARHDVDLVLELLGGRGGVGLWG